MCSSHPSQVKSTNTFSKIAAWIAWRSKSLLNDSRNLSRRGVRKKAKKAKGWSKVCSTSPHRAQATERRNHQPAFIAGHRHPREATVPRIFPFPSFLIRPKIKATLEKLNPNASTSSKWLVRSLPCRLVKKGRQSLLLSAQPATVSCAELLRSCVERNGRRRSGFLGQDHSSARQDSLCHGRLCTGSAHRVASCRTTSSSSSALLRGITNVCFAFGDVQ